MSTQKKPVVCIWEAVAEGDVNQAENLFRENPEQINAHIPFGGGTFLHLAASEPSLEMIKCLLNIGFDLNKTSKPEGVSALDVACRNGNYDIAEYLLDHGARMETDTSLKNPLFGAIIGRSAEITKLLLRHGIDTSARYTGDNMKDMDAIAFAMERGERDIARIIAEWNANGDAAKAEELLAEGLEIARLNNQPR